MATKQSGGRASAQRNKDQARAAYMKERGIVRRVARCPLCHRIVNIDMYNHIVACKGD